MQHKFKILLGVLLLFLAMAAFFAKKYSGEIQKVIVEKIENAVVKNEAEKNLLHHALGMEQERNYLILFLNNTELRPGGGFIGAYAVVSVNKGIPSVEKVEGTEILDNLAPDFISEPPPQIKKSLKVSKWSFRDSNWWPDFAVSSQKSYELYVKEKGYKADKIDAVIGFTPTVMEELMGIIGPVKVGNKEFRADNFTELLEYEVEYGYAKEDIEIAQRKKLIEDLGDVILKKVRGDLFKNWQNYLKLAERMVKEKHILAYSFDLEVQKELREKKATGEMFYEKGDFLLWSDANLGALKTDAAVKRELSYSFKQENEKIIATAKMKYIHNGKFDWRTSRYISYARIYVPKGSKLLETNGSMIKQKSDKPGEIIEENFPNFSVFGTYIFIEPGQSRELSFTYELPINVIEEINNKEYNLYVQKQAGTIDHKLTVNLDFAKRVIFAMPGEERAYHGDNKYTFSTDLKEDRSFHVKTE